GDLAILDRQPGPTRPELGDAGLDKILLHFCDRAEVGDDLFFQVAGKLVTATIGFHPLPKMQVVVVLARIVEEAGVLSKRAFHDVFERFSFPLGSFDDVVGVVDVGQVVLVVVVFERLARHVGGERVILVGKIGQRKRHRLAPQMIKRSGRGGRISIVTGACQPRFRVNSLGRSGRPGNGSNLHFALTTAAGGPSPWANGRATSRAAFRCAGLNAAATSGDDRHPTRARPVLIKIGFGPGAATLVIAVGSERGQNSLVTIPPDQAAPYLKTK